MQTKIRALNQTGVEIDFKATEGGILYAAPNSLLWTAKGYGYQAMSTVSAAALVVRPTTVANVTLRNASTGKILVMERAFAHMLVGDSQSDYGIWLCCHTPLSTAGANEITVRNSANGGAVGGSETTFELDANPVIDDGWFPWGPSYTTVTDTTPGGQLIAEIDGRLLIPSMGSISLQVVSTKATGLFTAGFHWFEVPVDELLNS